MADQALTEPADRPGVLVLPPLLYFGALILGLLLNWKSPLPLSVPTWLRWVAGAVALAGFVFGGAARAQFSKAGTNVNPMKPATAIVRAGVFGLTRNPMYVGMAVVLLGLAFVTRDGWLLILLVPMLVIMHWGVVLREERYLTRKFGAEYLSYRATVRRYF
jgi:protein-S-isoprenylcysteine O-methyltransferase Ste14